jgi:hypothetical protein
VFPGELLQLFVAGLGSLQLGRGPVQDREGLGEELGTV